MSQESNVASQQAFAAEVDSIRGVQISRFVDDKLAERWGSSERLAVLGQLGLA